MLAASSGKCNDCFGLASVRPSVCLSRLFSNVNRRTALRRILKVTHQVTARDMASVHFHPSIKRTETLVCSAVVIRMSGAVPCVNAMHRITVMLPDCLQGLLPAPFVLS